MPVDGVKLSHRQMSTLSIRQSLALLLQSNLNVTCREQPQVSCRTLWIADRFRKWSLVDWHNKRWIYLKSISLFCNILHEQWNLRKKSKTSPRKNFKKTKARLGHRSQREIVSLGCSSCYSHRFHCVKPNFPIVFSKKLPFLLDMTATRPFWDFDDIFFTC